MSIQPRSEVLALSEAVHGGIDEAELSSLGIDRNSIIDFSSNVNPFAPSPDLLAAIAQVRLKDYPDRDAENLRRVLAVHLAVSNDQLLVANGSSELLWLIAMAYLRPQDRVVVVGPTYSEYARSAQLMGASVLCCDASPDLGFAVPAKSIEAALRTKPRIVYLCNPNNPTGRLFDTSVMERWVREFAETLFVVDEAYIDFAVGAHSLVHSHAPNLIVLRSMTKAYGLAGLRLGYLVADSNVVRTLCAVRVPWSVNAIAQTAGVMAIQDHKNYQLALAQLLESKQMLIAQLEANGFHPLASSTAFFLLPVSDAKQTRLTLLRSHILVRDCTSFGLSTFIRISAQLHTENLNLVQALCETSSS